MVLILVAAALAALPAAAGASARQISIFADDAVLRGLSVHDAEASMREVKRLGADMVRTAVSWRRVSPRPFSRRKPGGFDVGDPRDPGYDWSSYDAFVSRARRSGLKVYLTLSPPIPYWASEEPRRCPHFIGGYRKLGRSCYWKPRPKLFGQFVKAVARRYRGRVSLYSMWNEPNLEHYLYPPLRRTRFGVVDVAARRYRSLWHEGWKAIARYDRPRRGKVLFGETAAISSPMDTLRAALCLDPDGRPFRGRLRALQGCRNPRRLAVGGFAHHPYAQQAAGSVFERTKSIDSLPLAYLGRLHALIAGAARHGRIPRGRGIYLSEFGFQSKPPDRYEGLSLGAHARSINEADRLFHRDRRVRSVTQFQLYDVPEPGNRDAFNTGLRFYAGPRKPAWHAYRMPLVAERISSRVVELWGQVRPTRGRTTTVITARGRGGRRARVARVRTNRSGFFGVRVRRPAAARLRYRSEWRSRSGELMKSRVAGAGRRIRYLG